jgi:hypothetical protein
VATLHLDQAQDAFIALIRYLERPTVIGPGLSVIVDPRRRNVGVPEPLLHLGGIGLVV